MRKEEYQNRIKLKKLFEVLSDYAKTSPEALKDTSNIFFEVIKTLKDDKQ